MLKLEPLFHAVLAATEDEVAVPQGLRHMHAYLRLCGEHQGRLPGSYIFQKGRYMLMCDWLYLLSNLLQMITVPVSTCFFLNLPCLCSFTVILYMCVCGTEIFLKDKQPSQIKHVLLATLEAPFALVALLNEASPLPVATTALLMEGFMLFNKIFWLARTTLEWGEKQIADILALLDRYGELDCRTNLSC